MAKEPVKRRMEKFTINEISFVNKPAQAPAVADIMKGDFTSVSDAELLDSAFWDKLESEFGKNGDMAQLSSSVVNDHEHAIRLSQDEKSGKVYIWVQHASSSEDSHGHEHQVVVDEDGTYRLTENVGHTHEIDQEKFTALLAASAMAMGKASSDVNEAGASGNETVGTKKESAMTDEEKKLMDAMKAELAEMKMKLKQAKKQGNLTDKQKKFADKMDDTAKAAFIEKSSDERDADIAKAEDADAVIYKSLDGAEYRKSDDSRLVALAKKADEDSKELALEKAARNNDRLEKAAEADLPFMKGDVATRAALLKAVEGIEAEALRNDVMESLKAHNDSMAEAFVTKGHSTGPSADDLAKSANDKLEEATAEIMKSDSISYAQAYTKACDQNPQLANEAIAG